MKKFLKFLKEEEGGHLIEYGLLAVLIAIAIITGANLLGTELNDLFNALGTLMGTGTTGMPATIP